jgi:hypothetical protein
MEAPKTLSFKKKKDLSGEIKSQTISKHFDKLREGWELSPVGNVVKLLTLV